MPRINDLSHCEDTAMAHARVFMSCLGGVAAITLCGGCVPDGCQIFGGDAFCSDSLYCNGADTCSEESGLCEHAGNPCIDMGLMCDETSDTCVVACGDDQVAEDHVCYGCLTHDDCDQEGASCIDRSCVCQCTSNDDCSDGNDSTTDLCIYCKCIHAAIACQAVRVCFGHGYADLGCVEVAVQEDADEEGVVCQFGFTRS